MEYALESLISQLEEAGIADDTVIALVSDYYPNGLLPTLLNLFGVEYDSRVLSGRDLLSECNPPVFRNDGSRVTDIGSWDAQNKEYTPQDGST